MKKRRATGMNLFSFQDIIMSVMGILLLITLLLTLFLVTPSEASFGKGQYQIFRAVSQLAKIIYVLERILHR